MSDVSSRHLDSPQRRGLRRLGAVGRRWSAPPGTKPEIRALLEPYPRWWPTPGWAWNWFSAGMDVARKDGTPVLRGGWISLKCAWLWATSK